MFPLRKLEAANDQYDLESDTDSQDSVPLAYLRYSSNWPAHERALESVTGALCNTTDDIELQEYQTSSGAKKGARRSTTRSVRISPCSIDVPAPVLFRYHRSNTSQAATPLPLSRHSTACYHWDKETTPNGGTRDACMDVGAVTFRDRSSLSLDLASDSGRFAGAEEHMQRPAAAWLSNQSQPEIAHRCSRRMSGLSDGEGGLGACPICLEEFDIGEQLRELPCLHKYHVVCIDTWLVSRSTCCPYCKLDIRRWYYGPACEDDMSQLGPMGEPSRPIDFHEMPPASNGNSSSDISGNNSSRGRYLRRNRSGGRLGRAMEAIRVALADHGNVAMHQ